MIIIHPIFRGGTRQSHQPHAVALTPLGQAVPIMGETPLHALCQTVQNGEIINNASTTNCPQVLHMSSRILPYSTMNYQTPLRAASRAPRMLGHQNYSCGRPLKVLKDATQRITITERDFIAHATRPHRRHRFFSNYIVLRRRHGPMPRQLIYVAGMYYFHKTLGGTVPTVRKYNRKTWILLIPPVLRRKVHFFKCSVIPDFDRVLASSKRRPDNGTSRYSDLLCRPTRDILAPQPRFMRVVHTIPDESFGVVWMTKRKAATITGNTIQAGSDASVHIRSFDAPHKASGMIYNTSKLNSKILGASYFFISGNLSFALKLKLIIRYNNIASEWLMKSTLIFQIGRCIIIFPHVMCTLEKNSFIKYKLIFSPGGEFPINFPQAQPRHSTCPPKIPLRPLFALESIASGTLASSQWMPNK